MDAIDISNFDLTSVVTIVLQNTGTEIVIHKQVLCTHCAFAEVCLQGDFQEVAPNRILVQEEEEDIIRELIAWMLIGKAIPPQLQNKDDPNAKEVLPALALRATKLYLTASKYLMTNFRNDMMLFWTKLCRTHKSFSFILPSLELLLKNGTSTCELKQLLIGRLHRNINEEYKKGSKSFFIEHPQAPYSKVLFTLMYDHPAIASTILQKILQPEVQTVPDKQQRHKKRRHDDGEDSDLVLHESSVNIKRRRPS